MSSIWAPVIRNVVFKVKVLGQSGIQFKTETNEHEHVRLFSLVLNSFILLNAELNHRHLIKMHVLNEADAFTSDMRLEVTRTLVLSDFYTT
jgi:hypothetical protein